MAHLKEPQTESIQAGANPAFDIPDTDSMRGTFSQHGIRCTRQRTVIFSVLEAMRTHPTAEELFRVVRTIEPRISLATVYNTLEVFARQGLCRRVARHQAGGAAPCRFDSDTSDHIHAISSCGTVSDVPDDLSSEIIASIPADVLLRIESKLGVRVKRVHIDLVTEPDSATTAAVESD